VHITNLVQSAENRSRLDCASDTTREEIVSLKKPGKILQKP
ncbi:hypothetical protein HMPREF1580_01176, partial [Gardnerella vaginalis JCP8070]